MADPTAFQVPHSPVATLGTIVLWIAMVVAAYSAAAGIVGNAQHRRRLVNSSATGLYGFGALMLVASSLLIYAFVSHDYAIKYVTKYSDTSMPLYYKITAYWGGLDGSLMFWVTVLSIFSTIAVATNRKRHSDMIGYVVGTIMVVQLFFMAILVFDKDPFATWLTQPPPDGEGLNPLLQTYWMTIHPPSLYIGFVAATIPFAFGIGALASGRLDDKWLGSVRVWTLICWFFLSFGLILGGRWAYEELGWGGYWAWDPVENAGFLPWFTATAFLHAVIIQEQRGMMKVWNLVLVIVTFFLTIFGTFMTRSGIVQSVHSFGEDHALALIFILFLAFVVIVSFGLLLHRLPQLRSKATFDSVLSREFAFLLNNWILLGCAFFVLFATMFPTLSEAAIGERITQGPEFFNRLMTPAGLVLLFLAGAAPLMAWRQTRTDRLGRQFQVPLALMAVTVAVLAIFVPTARVLTPIIAKDLRLPVALVNFGLVAFTLGAIGQEFWGGMRVRMKQTGSGPYTSLIGIILAKRRKYGGYIVHAGIAVMFIGFAGKAFDAEENFTLTPGETFSIRDYQLKFNKLTRDDTNAEHVIKVFAHVQVDRGGDKVADLMPEKRDYRKSDQPTSEVAIHSQIDEDLYLVLNGFDPQGTVTSFTVFINPLINWVWIGFGILALGTFFCLYPAAWVERMSRPVQTRKGRAAEIAVIAIFFGASTFGIVRLGHAQSAPPGAAEHDTGGHQVGVTGASINREDDAKFLAPFRAVAESDVAAENPSLDPDSPEFRARVDEKLKPIVALAERTFRDLVCLCGGCTRENLHQCRCGYAAEERGEVLAILGQHDLWLESEREAAYQDALDTMVAKYEAKEAGGGQRVLTSPPQKGFNRLGVWVPYGAVALALLLLIVFGRSWVRRTRRAEAASAPPAGAGETPGADEEYEDQLDDELAGVD